MGSKCGVKIWPVQKLESSKTSPNVRKKGTSLFHYLSKFLTYYFYHVECCSFSNKVNLMSGFKGRPTEATDRLFLAKGGLI